MACHIAKHMEMTIADDNRALSHRIDNRKVTKRGDRLILDGKDYSCSNLHQVPRDVHPAKLAESSNATTLVFGGSTSGHHNVVKLLPNEEQLRL